MKQCQLHIEFVRAKLYNELPEELLGCDKYNKTIKTIVPGNFSKIVTVIIINFITFCVIKRKVLYEMFLL